MNKPVLFISIAAGLVIIFAVKSLFIGIAIMLGGTLMSVVLANVSNSTFGSYDDDDEQNDITQYPAEDERKDKT